MTEGLPASQIEIQIANHKLLITDCHFLGILSPEEARQFTLVTDKAVKLVLINLAMHFYEDYSLYFTSRNTLIPFVSANHLIKKQTHHFTAPQQYFKYLTENLSEDWYVSFSHQKKSVFDQETYFLGETNYPRLSIIPKSEISRSEEKHALLKEVYARMLQEYLSKDYSYTFDSVNNLFRGKAILIHKEAGGSTHGYRFYFKEMDLLTPDIWAYAFLEQSRNRYLKSGIYELTAEYKKEWGILYEGGGFLIKEARLITEFPTRISDRKGKPVEHYKWDFITDIISFILDTKALAKNTFAATIDILKSIALLLIGITMIIGLFYWIVDSKLILFLWHFLKQFLSSL